LVKGEAPVSNPILQVSNLHKTFGGLIATDNVSFDVKAEEIHAVIGPNGAGKTTLISQLSGEQKSNSGSVQFKGQDVTHLPVHKRARMGLARSFQITSLMMDISVLDNVALAVQAHQGHSFRFIRPVKGDRNLTEPALAALHQVSLDNRANDQVAELSHGELRQLEIAMAIASHPALLLLDEPMAGMGTEEAAMMIKTLEGLKGKTPMLLVEHDMDTVFALADRISVLVYGKIIATGSVDEIRSNSDVRKAYLGDEA
jgi:branched-chain amino acid transport system ATP-binding protein